MKGRVIGIDVRKGFFAIKTDGGITVAETLEGPNVEMGDIISGNLESEGGETFINETQGIKTSVFVQGTQCTPEFAKHLLESE